jgi:hypothetical protein
LQEGEGKCGDGKKKGLQSLLGCGHLVGNVITEHSKINVGS